MKRDLGKRKLIGVSGLSLDDLLAMRWYYISNKKKVYGKDVKLNEYESFPEYVLFISRESWRGILLVVGFSLFFAVYDFYKNHIGIRALQIFLFLFPLLFLCIMKVNADSIGVRFKTVMKLFYLRLLVILNYV